MSTAVEVTSAISGVRHSLLVSGAWREATGGRTFTVEDPATGEGLCAVADASPEDAIAALDAASSVQLSWARTAPRERAEILRRAHQLLLARIDHLAMLITLEMGKSLLESRREVSYAADYFGWFSEEAVRIAGEWKVNGTGDGRIVTMRQPVGPCLLITPWNVPLALPARKVAPAIAAGCTMVLKPASQTPLCALALAEVLAEAGLPDGVINVIPTSTSGPTTKPLFDDPRLRKVSFTGSTAVGKILLGNAAANVLRVSMELGGNAPFIVCADADVDAAVRGAVTAKMRNLGEACVAANRFLVHDDVAEEFTTELAARLGSMVVGSGLDPATDVGPLIDTAARDHVAALVDDAVDVGARLVVGGAATDGPGHFYPPTVLADVPRSARLWHEEIFGPVAPIATFTDDEEMVRTANDTQFGLVSYLFTRDVGRAVWLSERLESGMVGLNRGFVSDAGAPFGGVKHSGLGREGGSVGIDEYLEIKYVALDVPPG
jgi:succinate-semialdehyde dehydrogenase / glutarate-semialdehyde dehydrogenase